MDNNGNGWGSSGQWPSNSGDAVEVETQPALTPEEQAVKDQLERAHILDRVRVWIYDKSQLEAAKTKEMDTRKEVRELAFKAPKRGTNKFPLTDGYNLKFKLGYNYKLGDAEKTDDEGIKVKIRTQVNELEEKIIALGPMAEMILEDGLISWNPTLSESKYNALREKGEVGTAIKEMIDEVLTVSEAAPSLEIEPPKEK